MRGLKRPCCKLLKSWKETEKTIQAGIIIPQQPDDSRTSNEIPLTGKDIRHALDCLISNQPVPEMQRPSIGCNVKWK